MNARLGGTLLTTFEIKQHAQQVLQTPGGATLVRMRVAASGLPLDEIAETMYSVLTQTVKDAKAELAEKIAELERQITARKDAARKLKVIADKLTDLMPQLEAAMTRDPGCKATPVGVAVRTGKLQTYLAAIEAAIAASGSACPPSVAARVKRYRAVLQELPQMFHGLSAPQGR